MDTYVKPRKPWSGWDRVAIAFDLAVNAVVGLLQLTALLIGAVWVLIEFPNLNPGWTDRLLPLAAVTGGASLLIAGVLSWWQRSRRRRKAAVAKALLAAPPLRLLDVIGQINFSRSANSKQPLTVPAGLDKIMIPYSRAGVTMATLYDLPDGARVCFVSIAPGSAGQPVPLPELVERF